MNVEQLTLINSLLSGAFLVATPEKDLPVTGVTIQKDGKFILQLDEEKTIRVPLPETVAPVPALTTPIPTPLAEKKPMGIPVAPKPEEKDKLGYLTIKEAAEILGISKCSIVHHIKTGRLHRYKGTVSQKHKSYGKQPEYFLAGSELADFAVEMKGKYVRPQIHVACSRERNRSVVF